MFWGPVLNAELTTAARRTRYFVLRVFYALLLLASLCLIYMATFGFSEQPRLQTVAEFGQYFFTTYSILQLGAILLVGPAVAASSIARERQRRTIEYLFTTHLTNLEIVLGKFVAAVVQIGTAILVGVPILALAMMLGGISPEVLAASYLVALSTVVAVVSVSLMASVLAQRPRDAIVAVYLLTVLLLLGPSLSSWIVRSTPVGPWFEEVRRLLAQFNPLAVLAEVMDTSNALAADRWQKVLVMCGGHLLLAAMSTLFSVVMLRRLHGSVSVPTEGSAEQARARRPAPQSESLLLWKEMHTGKSRTRLAWWGRLALALVICGCCAAAVWFFVDSQLGGQPDSYLDFAAVLGTVVQSLLMLLCGALGSNAIASERENDTWVMLISTRLHGGEILRAKVLGTLYSLRWGLLPLGVLWLLALVIAPGYGVVALACLITLTLLSCFSSLLGVVISLHATSSVRALGLTMACLFAGILVGSLCCCPLGFVSPVTMLSLPQAIYSMAEEPAQLAVIMIMWGSMWLFGLFFYVALSWFLWDIAARRFDHLAGRSSFTAATAPPVPSFMAPEQNA